MTKCGHAVIVPVISCAQRMLPSLVEILTDQIPARRGSLKNNTDNALWKDLTLLFATLRALYVAVERKSD